MRFIIDGDTFEAASLERVTGRDALELPRQTGLGLQTLAKRLEESARLTYAPDGTIIVVPDGVDASADEAALIDSEPHLRALLAFLWLSRRAAGDHNLTFDESCNFPFASLTIEVDEPDEVEAATDPTLPGSDPVVLVVAAAN